MPLPAVWQRCCAGKQVCHREMGPDSDHSSHSNTQMGPIKIILFKSNQSYLMNWTVRVSPPSSVNENMIMKRYVCMQTHALRATTAGLLYLLTV